MYDFLDDANLTESERLEVAKQLLEMKQTQINELRDELDRYKSERDHIRYANHQMGS
jgi:hypothetical protein